MTQTNSLETIGANFDFEHPFHYFVKGDFLTQDFFFFILWCKSGTHTKLEKWATEKKGVRVRQVERES